jgi:hypothetical protein
MTVLVQKIQASFPTLPERSVKKWKNNKTFFLLDPD